MTDHRVDVPHVAALLREDLLRRLSVDHDDGMETLIGASAQERPVAVPDVVAKTRAARAGLEAALDRYVTDVTAAVATPS